MNKKSQLYSENAVQLGFVFVKLVNVVIQPDGEECVIVGTLIGSRVIILDGDLYHMEFALRIRESVCNREIIQRVSDRLDQSSSCIPDLQIVIGIGISKQILVIVDRQVSAVKGTLIILKIGIVIAVPDTTGVMLDQSDIEVGISEIIFDAHKDGIAHVTLCDLIGFTVRCL